MPNPGSFRGSRFDFMVSQKAEWARAVEEEYATEMLSTIQRRYFRRYPVDLPHDVEPSAEHLASVDDDGPDIEVNSAALTDQMVVPMTGHPPCTRGELIRFRKVQIQRWLVYQYAKDHSISKRKKKGLDNPYIGFFARLSGRKLGRPRKRTPANVWRKTPGAHADIETEYKRQVQQAIADKKPIASKDLIATRDAVARALFKKLPPTEQKAWEAQAEVEAVKAKKEHEESLKAPPSTDPESRQLAIQMFPEAIKPILDYVCEATGMKASAFLGGPEPARGGQISIISVHSGTTKGDVPVNFGQFQPKRFLEELVPVFTAFIKACYTPAECRAQALSSNSGFVPLSDLEPPNEDHPNALGTGVPSSFVHPIDTSVTLWDGMKERTIDAISMAGKTKTTIDVSMTGSDNPFPFELKDDWPPTGSEVGSSPPSPVTTPRATPEPADCEDKNGVQIRLSLPPPCLIISPHGSLEYTELASEEEQACPILVLPDSQVVNAGGYTTIHSAPLPPSSTPIDPALVIERAPYFMRPNADAVTQGVSSQPNPGPPLPNPVLNVIIRSALDAIPLSPLPSAPTIVNPGPAQSEPSRGEAIGSGLTLSKPSIGKNGESPPTPAAASDANSSTAVPSLTTTNSSTPATSGSTDSGKKGKKTQDKRSTEVLHGPNVEPAPTTSSSTTTPAAHEPQPAVTNPNLKRTRDNLSLDCDNVLEAGVKRTRTKSQKALALELEDARGGVSAAKMAGKNVAAAAESSADAAHGEKRGRGRPRKAGPKA